MRQRAQSPLGFGKACHALPAGLSVSFCTVSMYSNSRPALHIASCPHISFSFSMCGRFWSLEPAGVLRASKSRPAFKLGFSKQTQTWRSFVFVEVTLFCCFLFCGLSSLVHCMLCFQKCFLFKCEDRVSLVFQQGISLTSIQVSISRVLRHGVSLG